MNPKIVLCSFKCVLCEYLFIKAVAVGAAGAAGEEAPYCPKCGGPVVLVKVIKDYSPVLVDKAIKQRERK